MKTIKIVLAASAALLVSSVAFAADPPKFGAADANGDGAVDAAEFAATKIDRVFAKLDKNKDGKLDAKEYEAALEEDCE